LQHAVGSSCAPNQIHTPLNATGYVTLI
jgi:hypothetical protein